MAFFGRGRELALLDQMCAKPGAHMFLLYGRRRVGKTELLRHWIQTRKHPALYWQAELFPSKIQLAQFSQIIQQARFSGQLVASDFTFGSWEHEFLEIAHLARATRLVVVLDEFTYAAINEDAHAILLGECKWTMEPVDHAVVTNHLIRAEKIIPDPADRWKVYHIFFSKSGFTLDAKRAAAKAKCFWVDLKQLESDLRNLSQ